MQNGKCILVITPPFNSLIVAQLTLPIAEEGVGKNLGFNGQFGSVVEIPILMCEKVGSPTSRPVS